LIDTDVVDHPVIPYNISPVTIPLLLNISYLYDPSHAPVSVEEAVRLIVSGNDEQIFVVLKVATGAGVGAIVSTYILLA